MRRTKLGLVAGRIAPQPRAMPWTNVVLPVPRSPRRQTRSPGRRSSPRRLPSLWLCSALWLRISRVAASRTGTRRLYAGHWGVTSNSRNHHGAMSSLGFLLRLRRRERKSRPRKDPGPFPPQPLPTLRLMKLMTSAGPSFRAGTASRLSESARDCKPHSGRTLQRFDGSPAGRCPQGLSLHPLWTTGESFRDPLPGLDPWPAQGSSARAPELVQLLT